MPVYTPFDSPPPRKTGMSTAVKVLLIVGLSFGLLCLICVGTCTYFLSSMPPADVMTGANLPREYVQQLKDLGMLEEDETLAFFYSDSVTSISSGVYILTDKRLVLYSDTWATPKVSIPLDEITNVDVNYSNSMLVDSSIVVSTKDAGAFTFPVTMIGGGDKIFFRGLEAAVDTAKGR